MDGNFSMERLFSTQRPVAAGQRTGKKGGEAADAAERAEGNTADSEERNIVRFELIPRKVFLFDRESGNRIYFDRETGG